MRILLLVTLAGVLFLPVTMPAQHLSADGASQTFEYLSDQYFDQVYFKYQPTAGTAAGLHEYDLRLEDYSPQTLKQQRAALAAWEKKIAAVPADGLDGAQAADREILLNSIRATELQFDTLKPLERDPNTYVNGATNSIFVLMERPFAPASVRLLAVVAREKLIPLQLQQARANLKNPPKIYTEIALEQIADIVSFFQNDVPSAFTEVKDPAAKAEFAKSNAAVIAALQEFGVWMKADLLPRSNGDFRYGADTFRKALALNEQVDIPLDRLLQIAMDDLHKNQAEFARVAKEVDATKTPQEVLAMLNADHPAAGALLPAFQGTFDSLIHFIRTKKIITIPSDVQPTLEETPPFERATTQASMDPPGPFETRSTKAYFNVTLPEKDWTPERTAQYLGVFNVGTIISTSVHEAYPGHYVQFLWSPQVPSKVRKLIGANTNIEGWAHYCEQMMLDEGYGQPGTGAKDAREAHLIRLGQLVDALLRDARFIVAIRMHTGVGGAMSMEEAASFFVTEGYQAKPVGTMEVKRGTSDALYLYYTLGKLEIMKLREDVRAKQGAAFSLQKFHDDFMRQGFVPIKVIRKQMLKDDSPVL